MAKPLMYLRSLKMWIFTSFWESLLCLFFPKLLWDLGEELYLGAGATDGQITGLVCTAHLASFPTPQSQQPFMTSKTKHLICASAPWGELAHVAVWKEKRRGQVCEEARLIPNYRCFKPHTYCRDHMELYTQVKQAAERVLSFKSLKINPGLGIFSSAGRIPA